MKYRHDSTTRRRFLYDIIIVEKIIKVFWGDSFYAHYHHGYGKGPASYCKNKMKKVNIVNINSILTKIIESLYNFNIFPP